MDIDLKTEDGKFKYRVAGVLIDKENRLLVQKIADNIKAEKLANAKKIETDVDSI